MKLILDTKSEKGGCIDYCFIFVYFNVAVPHLVISCEKYLVKFGWLPQLCRQSKQNKVIILVGFSESC